MKSALLFVVALWFQAAHAQHAIHIEVRLEGVEAQFPFTRLVFHSQDRSTKGLNVKRFHLKHGQNEAWVALNTNDLDVSAAVLEYVANLRASRILQVWVPGDLVRFYQKSRIGMGLDWDTLNVEIEGRKIPLEDLSGYLRYRQGLYARNFDRVYVKRILDHYLTETNRPKFYGYWSRCARLLAHIPGYKLE